MEYIYIGTYGTTHIKSDDKILDFTDSHDGYFSGMGLAAMVNIHHFPTSFFPTSLMKIWAKRFHQHIDNAQNIKPTRIKPSARDIHNFTLR